jgi:hypothetical protein
MHFSQQQNQSSSLKLLLILQNLITIPTQSLRFDTLNITLSYEDLYYCEWFIIIDIIFS